MSSADKAEVLKDIEDAELLLASVTEGKSQLIKTETLEQLLFASNRISAEIYEKDTQPRLSQ